MNGLREGKTGCYLHPQDFAIGVCHLCLNERLLILASKEGHQHRTYTFTHRKPSISLPKIFSLGYLLSRIDIRRRKSEDFDYTYSSSNQEDSFITIKFEDNGAASWEKDKVISKVSLERSDMSWDHSLVKEAKGPKTVVEHVKPRGTLRWRKRIGQVIHLIKWKRSSNCSVCHVGNNLQEGVKVGRGWISALTKRRIKE